MLIDWFTIAAQVVNFLVLVWLMKRFLYQPILSAIDARETGIAAKLAEAKATEAKAQAERDALQQKSDTFEQQRAAVFQKATEDAAAERDQLLAKARRDADAVRAEWQEALRNEQKGLSDAIVRRTQQGVFEIARKALAGLATADLEASMCGAFVTRLRSLSGPDHDQFASALSASSQGALVHSAFDLPPAQRAAIEAAVRETFTVQPQMRFETSQDLVSGIELSANGQKVAWSISDYLGALEESVTALVEEKTKLTDKEPALKAAVSAETAPEPKAKRTDALKPAAELVSR